MLEGRHSLKTLLLINTMYEFHYYYCYLLKIFSFSFFFFNEYIKKKLFFINKILYLYSISSLVKQNQLFSKYINYRFKYKIKRVNNYSTDKLKKIKYINYNHFKFFNLFFLFNYSIFNSNFKFHFRFNFHLIKEFKKDIILININKFFIRWNDAYNLMFNIFYYNFTSLTFGSFLMKNEILALNWYHSKININVWRYYFPFFIFKLNNYNKKSEFFFKKFFESKIKFIFVIDTHYHYKNLFYFKRYNYYSIGLINFNLDPTLVSYPILNFFSSYVTQLFFLRLILFIQKYVYLKKFTYFKNLWVQSNLTFYYKKN